MSVELLVEVLAAGLALWAVILSMPKPPSLDWERLFKVSLATRLRGELEAQNKGRSDWSVLLEELIPYHPAGRNPEEKIHTPDVSTLLTPALPGERALTEVLVSLADRQARWERMYINNDQTRDALMSDPDDLGSDYSVRNFFGSKADWAGIATWSEGVQSGLTRKLEHIVVVGVGGSLGDEMTDLSGLRGRTCTVEELPDLLPEILPAASDRLVLVLEGSSALRTVQLLHTDPGLRDRVLMVLSVGSDLHSSEAGAAWMAEHFTHAAMDTELNRKTAYASIQVMSPPGDTFQGWAGQRWPVPAESETGRSPIAPIDLGPIPPIWLTDDGRRVQLCSALWVCVAAWLA
jgi:hypothetical protein